MSIALFSRPAPALAPPPPTPMPDWSRGTVLRLLLDAQGAWRVTLPDTPGSPAWDAAELVRSIDAALLAQLIEATGDAGLLLRVLASQPRLQLELLTPSALVAQLHEQAVAEAPELPEALRAEPPPWLRGKTAEGAEIGETMPYLGSRGAQDWARASVPVLARGLPPPEPFGDTLWVPAQPLVAAQGGSRLSLLLPWQGEMLGLQFSGPASALDVDLLLASPYAMALARSRWPYWDGALARAGARVKTWRWHQRRLQRPAGRDAVDADPDLLRLAAELLWSL